jgi:serine/threonine protein kinase/DNA-binding winged helix-turn-helix (wHTH) protein/Flp pilus assembly protein TadD
MVPNGSRRAGGEAADRLWQFAGCEFDELRLELRVHGKPVELELKPLEVLQQLLRHSGEVLTKEELFDEVWPGLMVVDGSLATAVSKLRKALSDEDSTIVQTMPRVGYRLGVPAHSKPITAPRFGQELGLNAGDTVPGREHWRLQRPLDVSKSSEVWLAEHPKTHELRVFKFASNESRLKGLKREVTVSRYLREALKNQPEFVHILEWNFESQPYFLESEFGGLDLSAWAESQGGLSSIPVAARLRLLTEVAQAVAAAHGAGVLHKDLKPGNILVTPSSNGGWQVKVADFGSASLLEPSRLKALGITNLGLTQTGGPQSPSLTGTLMYLAPEVLSGQRPSAGADVYALGVMLYQLVAGDFRKPLSPGWEADIADPLLREDIAQAACGDPARRLRSAAELAAGLDSLERRRTERKKSDEARELQRIAERARERARARRPWVLVAGMALLVAVSISLFFYRRAFSSNPKIGAVAVLPFQNAGSDHTADYLSLALPDEIATQLSYTRALPIRPSALTSKYSAANLDLQKAGQEMGVSKVVTGHFLQAGEKFEVTLEAIDVASNRLLWHGTVSFPAGNMLAMQAQIAAVTRQELARTLGSPGYVTDADVHPKNEEAYDIYLRSTALAYDPVPNQQGIVMLEKAVSLDTTFGPAWQELARRYYIDEHYGFGGGAKSQRTIDALERAQSVAPNSVVASAQLVVRRTEQGQLAAAYEEAARLDRGRPDTAMAHFALSYVFRYAGLLEESANECEKAFAIDPYGVRSCAVAFILRGNYRRAMDYIHIDFGSEWANALTIHALVREGREREALQIAEPHIPQWGSFNMLLACVEHRPASEIVALANRLKHSDDPETNYFSASHLAYCGQTDAAIQMLKLAIQGNYCSYPAIDSDPFFASVRGKPEFAEVRSAAIACQNNFLAQRGGSGKD